MNPVHRCLTVSAGIFLLAGAHAQEWRADASYTWANNLSRTSYAADRLNAAVYAGAVTAQWHRQLTGDWSAAWAAEAGIERVPTFAGLDRVHAGAWFDLHRKFGLGPFAPVLSFNAGATRHELHEHGRSHWKTEAGVNLSQRLTETWRVSAGGSWEEDYARDKPFDIVNRRATVETTWDLTDRIQLSAGASRLWGELTANANQDIWWQALAGGFGPAVGKYYNTVPYEQSSAFGDDWIAYRIDCRADLGWLGATIALGEHTSLPLRYESVKVVNRVNVAYRSEFWSLSLVHRF